MRKCKWCKEPTTNKIGMRILCSIDCAVLYGKAEVERKQLRQKAEIRKNEKKAVKAAKERIKPLSKWLQEAQTEFNKFIRLRDAEKPCISCGCTEAVQWHAGHYRTTKAAGQHRFNEDNCHRQCSQDNLYHSGRIHDYRIRLVERIGEIRVSLLENDNRIHRWTVEELAAIKKEYAAKCRELTKNNEVA